MKKIVSLCLCLCLLSQAQAQIPTKPSVVPIWASGATPTNDILQPANSYITQGWPLSSTPPSRQYFNWQANYLFDAVRYQSRAGVATWDSAETYLVGDVVSFGNILYESNLANSVGNQPSSGSTAWVPINTKTQINGDNTTAVATTAFVHNNYVPLGGAFSLLGGQIGQQQVSLAAVSQFQSFLSIGYGQLTNVPTSVANIPNDMVIRDTISNVFVNTVNYGSPDGDNENVNYLIATNGGGDNYGRKTSLAYVEGKMALSAVSGQVTPGQVPAAAVAQYSPQIFSYNPSVSASPNGWVTLPGNPPTLLEWGYQCGTGANSNPIDFNINFPKAFPNNVWSVTLTGQRTVATNGQALNGSNFVSNLTKANFTATLDASGGGTACGHFMAVGD